MSMPKRRNSFCTAANRRWVAASWATAIMMPMFCLNMFQYPVTTEVKKALSSGESGSSTLSPDGVTTSCRNDSARAASRSSLSAKYR